MASEIAVKLLNWFAEDGRDLPWRHTRDPYRIWVSEIMLQQTRVETVIPYYDQWMQVFPTMASLAQASIEDVLRVWEGLGYYRRAHNLHQTARLLIEQQGGEFPQTVMELKKLPGLGNYTAAALAALAFDQPEIALDGNLRRVIARLIDLELEVRCADAGERLRRWAEEHLPPGEAPSFNQALMDLGAMICLPRNPRCDDCPIASHCQAYARGTTSERPVKKASRPIPSFQAAAGVIRRGACFAQQITGLRQGFLGPFSSTVNRDLLNFFQYPANNRHGEITVLQQEVNFFFQNKWQVKGIAADRVIESDDLGPFGKILQSAYFACPVG